MKYLYTFIAVIGCWALADAQIYVDQEASGANDGSSWADAYTELATAIDVAAEGDEIWVAEGTYLPDGEDASRSSTFYLNKNIRLYGGFEGGESAIDDRGDYKNHPTVMSGDVNGDDIPGNFDDNRSDNCMHIMWADTMVTNATVIDGFFFRNGSTDDVNGSGNDRRGGAILSYGAPVVQNCSFQDNYGYFGGATYPRFGDASNFKYLNCEFMNNRGGTGGAIYINSVSGGRVDNCTFSGNTSLNAGGAIYNQFSADTIRNCNFSNNASDDSRAAAMYHTESFVLVENCEFQENEALTSSAGGMHFASDDDPTQAIVRNCLFRGNQSGWGGGISAYNPLTEVLIENCEFELNSASTSGGALSVGFQASVVLDSCDVIENEANFGGGLFMQNDSSHLVVRNSLISTNTSENSGGGFTSSAGVILELEGARFEGNSTNGSGGAISLAEDSLDYAEFTMRKSQIIGNLAETQGGGINLQNVDAYIENSVLAFNSASVSGNGGAIANNAAPGGVSSESSLRMVNNTVFQNIGGIANGVMLWQADTAEASLSMQNNIWVHIGGNDFGVEAGDPVFESTGGNLSSDLLANTYLTHDSDIVGEEPLMVDPTLLEFQLTEGSPCVDAGEPDGAPDEDINGNPRDDDPDIGAYEYDETSAGQALYQDFDIRAYPNVTRGNVTLESATSETSSQLRVMVFDQEGRLILERKERPSTEIWRGQFDLSHLAPGTYHFRVITGKGVGGATVIRQ